jgi:hypothetical protein
MLGPCICAWNSVGGPLDDFVYGVYFWQRSELGGWYLEPLVVVAVGSEACGFLLLPFQLQWF